MARDQWIRVRLSARELELLEAAARAAYRDLSTYAREVLLGDQADPDGRVTAGARRVAARGGGGE